MLRSYARILRDKANFAFFKLQTLFSNKEPFECPICGYLGPFMDLRAVAGPRRHAKCPKCGALERHRLQYAVVKNVLRTRNPTAMKMLHFAPEPAFRPLFARQFKEYTTADLEMKDVDYNIDMRNLPFDDGSYDFVFASVVFDYIPDDERAIKEVRRVLGPNGIAILPVSLVGDKTVEYSEPNPYESYHVRACGMDYFERYERYFSKVERISSESVPNKYQPFIYEDRSLWPNAEHPLRSPMHGGKHVDVVPICYV